MVRQHPLTILCTHASYAAGRDGDPSTGSRTEKNTSIEESARTRNLPARLLLDREDDVRLQSAVPPCAWAKTQALPTIPSGARHREDGLAGNRNLLSPVSDATKMSSRRMSGSGHTTTSSPSRTRESGRRCTVYPTHGREYAGGNTNIFDVTHVWVI
ncbi:hypothetical protein C8Q76DRAFT_686602, partial [Earliella scabrosa]